MKLLICTQKVDKNDPILGFFHRWIIEFAKHFESVTVICLYEGEHDLPGNVKVLSLGKERGKSHPKYILRFFKYIWKERKNYDRVFVHMNQIYVILGGIFWRMWGKKVFLWYTHRMVGTSLRIATVLVNGIFTASKESFRIPTKKVKVMGHGIDTDIFSPSQKSASRNLYTILSVSRISPSKNQLVMTQAYKALKDRGFAGKLIIVGSPISEADNLYLSEIKDYIIKNNLQGDVVFSGSSSPHLVIDAYRNADLFINLSTTGSLDKAVLEAMACGLQILTANEAFKSIVPERNYSDLSPISLASKIQMLSKEKADPRLRQYVVEKNNINKLIPTLASHMKNI